jgi:hypothetical protein
MSCGAAMSFKMLANVPTLMGSCAGYRNVMLSVLIGRSADVAASLAGYGVSKGKQPFCQIRSETSRGSLTELEFLL